MTQAIEHTSQSLLNGAEICRANGWKAGTLLEAEAFPKAADPRPTRILVTSVGHAHVLAQEIDGGGDGEPEMVWNLRCRDWVEVGFVA